MKDYLTIPEASAVLGICPNAVRYHCRTGRIRCAKISGAWFVARSGIRAAMNRPYQERGRRRNGQSPIPLTIGQVIAQRPALPEPDNRTWQEKRAAGRENGRTIMHTVKFHGGPRDGMILHTLQLPSRFRVPMPSVDRLLPDLRIAEYELCTDPHNGIVSYVYVGLIM